MTNRRKIVGLVRSTMAMRFDVIDFGSKMIKQRRIRSRPVWMVVSELCDSGCAYEAIHILHRLREDYNSGRSGRRSETSVP